MFSEDQVQLRSDRLKHFCVSKARGERKSIQIGAGDKVLVNVWNFIVVCASTWILLLPSQCEAYLHPDHSIKPIPHIIHWSECPVRLS